MKKFWFYYLHTFKEIAKNSSILTTVVLSVFFYSFFSPVSFFFFSLSLVLRRLEAGSDRIAAAHRFPLPVYSHDIRMIFAWYSLRNIVMCTR